MKIKAVLIEDEIPARNTLKSYLRKYFPDVIVQCEIDNEEEAVNTLNHTDFDIVFLDVQLKHGSGVDVLRKVRKSGMRIIFTTAHEDYAMEAFQNKAFGYLLKPINPIDFKEIVSRVIKDLQSAEIFTKKIKVPTPYGNAFIATDSIIRCQSDSNYTHVHCQDKNTYIISKTLKYVEEHILNSHGFLRIHQSHLVNIQFIDDTKVSAGVVVLKDGTSLPVSRSRKGSLIEVISTKRLA